MIDRVDRPPSGDDEGAALTKEIRVRVLDCSATGCLVETSGAVEIGTVAVLRIEFGGQKFEDPVQVVRCNGIAGASGVHHVGTKFVTTTPPYAGTLRFLFRDECSRLAGWLRTDPSCIEPRVEV